MIRRPPRSTLDRSSAASDVYKRQTGSSPRWRISRPPRPTTWSRPVSYTHLRAHETPEHLVCRLLLEKKNNAAPLPTPTHSAPPHHHASRPPTPSHPPP